MPDDLPRSPDVVRKSSGITDSERYLEGLCETNFLSLWSYPRPFRDQGGNKELCDLLVVMGDDVIIFSDKHCVLRPKKTLDVDWQRWFRTAVQGGAKQAWGAERWLRQHPDRVFLDPECKRPLPVSLPPPERANYHLVVTVHGVSAACQAILGGTGSLVLRTDLQGFEAHTVPFHLGDLDPGRQFVHVFDDATLDFVMRTLDTTVDFVRYLREKEGVFRSRGLVVAGEENLLALHLTQLGEDGQHAIVLEPDVDVVLIDESEWAAFESSEERRAQLKADEVSYAWDHLIEQFAGHTLAGTQYEATVPAFASSETVLRFMAAESRFRRRMLGGQLLGALDSTPPDYRRLLVIPGQKSTEPMYVILLFPWRHDKPEQENRTARRKFLEACVYVARMTYRNAVDVVGIATESGTELEHRSEDALYFDASQWSQKDDERARSYQRDWGILENERRIAGHMDEYPVGEASTRTTSMAVPKNPRNKPCPCGSELKYKRCHGA